MRRFSIPFAPLAALLLALPLSGCDAIDDLFETGKEISGIIEDLGPDFLVVEGIEYRVTDKTEYEGIDGLEDLSVGDEVELEYKDQGDFREALEIELAGAEDGSSEDDTFVVTYAPPFNPAQMQTEVTNPFFPLPVGATWTYEGQTDEGTERIVVEVLAETRLVAGIEARVVRDRVFLNDALIEDTFDWYAQDAAGNVWYLGEDSKEIANGQVVGTAGSWETGVDGAEAGVIMPATPAVGQAYQQEFYAGEAEDRGRIIAVDQTITVPAGTYNGCVKTEDTTPLEPEVLEHKFDCPGIGTALEIDLREDARFELISADM